MITGHPIELPTSDGLLDPAVVEEVGGRVREVGDVEHVPALAAATEAGQIGHVRVELVREPLGGRQQVASRQPEAVHVGHHPRIGVGVGDSR